MSRTARRLLFAFTALILFFTAAALTTLGGLTDIHDGLHDVKKTEETARVALALASAVRDQYAHQAHTIILGDDSHVPLHEFARRRVLELSARLRERMSNALERQWLDEIDRASGELDRLFRHDLVPAVLRNDRPTIVREHARAQQLVTQIQDRADQIVGRAHESIESSGAHADAIQHGSFRWTVALLLGATLFAVGVGLYIGRSVARPLRRLEEGAERLARGDLTTRIDVSAPDEFGRLAEQINRMTKSLAEHQEQLVQSEKLAGIGRLAAGVAHEINNPLGVILGFARLGQQKAEGDLAADLKVIEDEALRCRDIVQGLIDFSRPKPTTLEPVDLRKLCDEVVHRLNAQGVKVHLTGHAAATASAEKLRQVVFNLLKNAVEAATPDGQVEVALTEDDGAALLSVTDSGPGLPAASKDRLFEPFFTTKASGTGLGLAVSRAIAQSHGGDIQAESPPGGGARFVLRLPQTRGAS